MLIEPILGFGLERFVADHVHSGRIELALESRPDFMLAGDQPVGFADDCRELLRNGEPVDRDFFDSHHLVRPQAGYADHGELVEVVGRNRQEANPLENWMPRVARLLEHPAIEG